MNAMHCMQCNECIVMNTDKRMKLNIAIATGSNIFKYYLIVLGKQLYNVKQYLLGSSSNMYYDRTACLAQCAMLELPA